MRLDLSYRTQYVYVPAVRGGLTALRLCPSDGPRLEVISAASVADPGRVILSYTDAWGTKVDVVETATIHRAATFSLTAEVETRPDEPDPGIRPYEQYAYRRDSARVRLAAVEAIGWDDGGMSDWEGIDAALRWLPQRLEYRIGETDAGTAIEEVIERGVGVCQDFAHVFLAWLRHAGWCARYVSGYMFSSKAAEGSIEAEAMHAWVEVYQRDAGWVGLDATTGTPVDGRYVAVGRGRDYDDVRPVRGVFLGRTSQAQSSRLSIARSSEQ
ncbi:MAG: transglutaminase family protein [Anaerolineaceae bacterium]